ncbi:hypothetical protein EJB05_00169, partial [Eragrostis curvula]
MTLGDDDGGRWRARPNTTLPVFYSSRVAVVRGVAYFILKNELDSGNIEPDSIASFDFAKEEWRSTILKGPFSSSLAPIAEEKHYWSWSHFMLAGLGDSLVMVHRNSRDCSTDLWFIDNQGMDDTLPLWTKLYSIPWEHSWRSIRPLQVLDDGRIIIWVEDAKVLRSYDPSTTMWHDFFTDSRAGYAMAAPLDDDPPVALANYGAGALPTDVLYCILLRLPADEVRRLRLVCRSWLSLTSDPHFARAHLSRHPQVVALHDNRDEIHVVDLNSGGNVLKRVRLVQKGLTLSSQHDALCVSHASVNGQAYMLDLAAGTAMADVTAKEPGRETWTRPTTVIGQVPATGEYKLIRFRSYSYHPGTASETCEIVTVRCDGCDETWRLRPCPLSVPVFHSSTTVVAGVAYFLVNAAHVDVEPDSVAVFDLEKEEWRPTTVQGPLSSSLGERARKNPVYTSHCTMLSGLSDCLVSVHCNYKSSSADIWFLVDMDKPVWSKGYSMRCEPFGMYPRYCRPLAVLDDGRVAVLLEGARIVRAYDPRTSAWTDLVRLKDYCAITMYHGSFLCSGAQG